MLQNDTCYFGNIVGRVANRIGKAQFTLNGTRYQLVNNDGDNLLHGMSIQLYSSIQFFFSEYDYVYFNWV